MISMRYLYLTLKITLQYSLRIFYPRQKAINSPKHLLGRTIYVSNHANSFMDPLVVAGLRMPIVFFMTRSDVFTPAMRPITWGCQMLPIYREHDGEDTKGKNEEVFKQCARILSQGRNLLVFGEGFTDDTFIRRLKPVKKGAVKIGFQTLEELQWKKKIYIAAVGCNYSLPHEMRSDLLISTSERICLNDFREEFEENPNKVITTLTRRIEKMMQEQITHVADKNMAPFHEHIMMITRKGMNLENFDRSIPLEKRWRYSQKLANWLNEQDVENDEQLKALKDESAAYFTLLKRFRINEKYLYWKHFEGSRTKEILMMIFLFPFAIIGAFHAAIPYIITKRFVEKSFRRKVFWASAKLSMGKILMGLVNIPFIFVFYYYIFPSWWLAIAYYFSIGLTGLAAYMWFRYLRDFRIKGILMKTDTSKLFAKREKLEKLLKDVIPVEFH